MSSKKPAPPKGTGPSGRRLWRSIVHDWELAEHEIALLRETVRCVDTLDRLAKIVARDGDMVDSKAGPRIHPAIVESRQLRIALARLVAVLRLPDGEDGDESLGRRQRRVGARGTYTLRSIQGGAS